MGRVEMASILLETGRVPTAVGTGVGPRGTPATGVGPTGTLMVEMVVLGGRRLEDKEMGKAKGACTRVGLVQVWEVFASTAQWPRSDLRPRGDPSHRKKTPGGAGVKGKGGRESTPGGGVGSVGVKTWLDGVLGSGGGMHEGRWGGGRGGGEGGESCRAPLPVGVVLSDW